jgi:hypothetical protein
MQVNALTNAGSLTAKVFTKETYAQNHCQIGNIKRALDGMLNWIPEVHYPDISINSYLTKILEEKE